MEPDWDPRLGSKSGTRAWIKPVVGVWIWDTALDPNHDKDPNPHPDLNLVPNPKVDLNPYRVTKNWNQNRKLTGTGTRT